MPHNLADCELRLVPIGFNWVDYVVGHEAK